MNDNKQDKVEELSYTRLRWCMEVGTRLAIEQAEFAVRARMQRLKTKQASISASSSDSEPSPSGPAAA